MRAQLAGAVDRPGVVVAAVDMGYGHLRAAHALASALRQEVVEVDREPFASLAESKLWRHLRRGYTLLSRASQAPLVGGPLGRLLDGITQIPHLYPYRDLSSPTLAVEILNWLIQRGLGHNLVRHLKRSGDCLLTTFFAPALAAAAAGVPRVVCVVTDSDVNRVWAPRQPRGTPIEYCVPSERALRRLRAYGVPGSSIHVTGFPLPRELSGGEDGGEQQRRLAARLVRLDPAGAFREQYREELAHVLGRLPEAEEGRPPLLTFAVGGAGAQARIARSIIPSVAPSIREGRLRLALVAGVRAELAEQFDSWVVAAGLGGDRDVEILFAPSLPAYFEAFNRLLERTDILWTKPSELTFFGAAGLALIFAPPVGAHERFNRRWAIQRGAGLKQYSPSTAGQWLGEWLQEGILAGAAWSAFRRLPRRGTTNILEVLRRVSSRA
ncbi:MAG: hypothetical protein HRF46_14375 [Acidobacteriota bacterium]|jgi:hypothetical protein